MAYDIRNMNDYGKDVAEVCKATNTWFSEDFTVYLYADGNWSDIPQQRDTIIKMAKEFAKKWRFINEIDDEPFEDEFMIYDSQTLTSSQLPEFIAGIQEIIDYAWDLNAAIAIKAHFVPEDGQKEKMLKLDIDDEHKMTVECRECNEDEYRLQ